MLSTFNQHYSDSIQTHNNRLALIHSFFSYIIGENPLSAELGQRVLRIPLKKNVHPALGYLNAEEAKNILESVDRTTAAGRRDYLLLALLYDSGARVQEVLDLRPCNQASTCHHQGFPGPCRREDDTDPCGN